MKFTPSIETLIQSLTALPGVGRKSATRMALFMIKRTPDKAVALGQALLDAVDRKGQCPSCRMSSDYGAVCAVCANPERHSSQLCVVEQESDAIAIERSGAFKGKYFILGGRISPLDGISPESLGMEHLRQKAETAEEIILALSTTPEGSATSYYICQLLEELPLKMSFLARGVPMGGELEYLDDGTLAQAITRRSTTGVVVS